MLLCISDNVLVSPHICCTCDQITHESLGVPLLCATAHLLTDGPSLWLLFVLLCFLFVTTPVLLPPGAFAVQYTPKSSRSVCESQR